MLGRQVNGISKSGGLKRWHGRKAMTSSMRGGKVWKAKGHFVTANNHGNDSDRQSETGSI